MRHGQSFGNVEGRFGGHGPTELTELGHRQARRTGEALAASFEATALVSSDLPRARQTVAPIAAATGLEVQYQQGLRERSLGIFDDLLFTEAEARYPEHWSRLMSREPDVCPPNGELIDAVFNRVGQAIDAIVAANPGGRVIVVSHGLAMFHAFAHICGMGCPSSPRVFLLVDNCSISLYEHASFGWRIRQINDTSHLAELETAVPSG